MEKAKKPGKPFWRSKTFWGLVVTAAVLFYNALRQAYPSLPPIPEQVLQMLAAAGLLLAGYGRAVADRPLTLGHDEPAITQADLDRARTRH